MDDVLIGDAERDAAVEELSAAYVAGKLTADELEQRTALALQARSEFDLVAPLQGLRRRVPVVAVPARRTASSGPSAAAVFGWLLIVMAVVLVLGLGIAGLTGLDIDSGVTFCSIDGEPTPC